MAGRSGLGPIPVQSGCAVPGVTTYWWAAMAVDHHGGPLGADMNRAMKFLLSACVVVVAASACTVAPPTGVVDVTAPDIHSVSVIPNEIAPGQAFTVEAFISDGVGVTGVTFVLRTATTVAIWCGGAATLASGTARTGVWALQCTAPTVVNAGAYHVNTIAADAMNNLAAITDGPPSDTTGNFTITGSTSDLDAPTVVTVTSTPGSVARTATLTISAYLTDPSGVQAVGFQARRDGLAPGWCAGPGALTSGTPTDGVWTLSCVVPANATIGTGYSIGTLYSDNLNNLGYVGDGPAGPTRGNFAVTA